MIGNEFFIGFLEEFRLFEANVMCLPSYDSFMEIYRAFYLFNTFDFDEASLIIEKNSGFKAYDRLKDQTNEMYHKLLN